MRSLDEMAMMDAGIPGMVLMENAARAVFEAARDMLGADLAGKKVTLVCGKGNNGGDGFAAARHFLNHGAHPEILLVALKSDVAGDAAQNLSICEKLGIPITEITAPAKIPTARARAAQSSLVVDALLGTGVRGPLSPLYAKIIETINASDIPVLSVDVPSGISVDDGRIHTVAVRAAVTVTFAAAKAGLYVYPGAACAGRVIIADICIPKPYIEAMEAGAYLIDRDTVSRMIRNRAPDAHKGTCGKLLFVGGSRGMSGASCLVARAAMRTGAGLIYMAVPESIVNIVETAVIEAVTIPLPETPGGSASAQSVDTIVEAACRVDAIVVGPGMTKNDDTIEIVRGIVTLCDKPIVMDADAINCIAGNTDLLDWNCGNLVFTPHAGEMARLIGIESGDVDTERLGVARSFASCNGTVLALKGAGTIIALPDGTVHVNPTGNPGMATGGSGDVLSGIIGALLAEGMPPADAAQCGVYLHGLAGDIAATRVSERSVIASDIAESISEAFVSLGSNK